MSASPDAVMRQWFQEVWNERREDAIDRLMEPGAKVHGLAGGSAFADFRVRDGRIAEGWNTFDFLTMYQQMGWVKSPVVGE